MRTGLPKTVTRQRSGCDLNSGSSAPESSTLTTRLSSHPSSGVVLQIKVGIRRCKRCGRGADVERRRREDRGAERLGLGEGVSPFPLGEEFGDEAVPHPQILLFLALKMVSFGAFWVAFCS